MVAGNIDNRIPEGIIIDPVTRELSFSMHLKEILPTFGDSVKIQLYLPRHLYWGTNEGWSLPSSIMVLMERWMATTDTFHLPFGKMTITSVDFAAITGLSFGGWSVVFNDRLLSLSQARLCEQTLELPSSSSPPLLRGKYDTTTSSLKRMATPK
ncbi:hypothetical protein JCGZ_19170 [Jatropha curcas]|uniref:Aminotransferase-like plant mobile domain-containing protein n=1 Tax=Jatropha curcas TaxID=180498 RepID=A0A067LAR9_JATCU|nr:hypothetical protein JCGZ_19170 [Jatropha curcas]